LLCFFSARSAVKSFCAFICENLRHLWIEIMTFKCYLGERHTRQAEEIAARIFARELRLCADPHEPIYVAFNFHIWRDCQVDAVLFTPHAITIIDWKDTLGPIKGSETGAWLRNGQPILAGSEHNENPYQQILRIRQSVAGYVRKNAAQLLEDGGKRFDQRLFSQVGAAIVFTPTDLEKDISLPSTTRSWLVLTGLDVAAKLLLGRRSSFNLRPPEIEAVLEKGWQCQPWAEIENVLPDVPVGTLWHLRPDGTREGRALTRSLTLGRGQGSEWVVTGDDVSRQHAHIHISGGEAMIYDLDSANGTFINNLRLTPGQAYKLNDGDLVTLGGSARLQFTTRTNEGDERTTLRK
jgi:hypothetical protein